jgi:hypothetical protein
MYISWAEGIQMEDTLVSITLLGHFLPRSEYSADLMVDTATQVPTEKF